MCFRCCSSSQRFYRDAASVFTPRAIELRNNLPPERAPCVSSPSTPGRALRAEARARVQAPSALPVPARPREHRGRSGLWVCTWVAGVGPLRSTWLSSRCPSELSWPSSLHNPLCPRRPSSGHPAVCHTVHRAPLPGSLPGSTRVPALVLPEPPPPQTVCLWARGPCPTSFSLPEPGVCTHWCVRRRPPRVSFSLPRTSLTL